MAAATGILFGGYMAAADATLFATAVPEVQNRLLAGLTLADRMELAAKGVVRDELVLRLAVLVPMVWALSVLRGKAGAGPWRLAIVLVAFVAFPLSAQDYFRAVEWTALTAAREVLLHGAAGVVWGWLCWRHGWLAGLGGHLAAQLALQPLLEIWR